MTITDLAARTRADAELMAAQAERLREIRDRIIGREGIPEWFDGEISAHIARCRTAAADLTTAARRLTAHVGSDS
ncbi:hypothetical protein [Nocardia sp. XZ_19_385]|uniref:hypothetical protein n=1 Tax=Nocardia sp. XZ_19_385 TaxID=2769488 RepID=UPI001890ABA0|nr:hypothetical protein [Nocardia sp. XZ_19_385]